MGCDWSAVGVQPTDRKGAAGAVIINESTAKKFFPGEDPIGRTVEIEGDRTIVGVVGDVHQFSLEIEPRAEAYMPMPQSDAFGADLVILLRVAIPMMCYRPSNPLSTTFCPMFPCVTSGRWRRCSPGASRSGN